MSRAERNRRVRAVTGGCLSVAGMFGALVAALQWSGCTVTPENYGLLSTFFDGVPDPSVPARVADLPASDPRRTATYSVHQPFAKEECDTCHKSRIRPTRSNGTLCLECHKAIASEHTRTHGPVAAAAVGHAPGPDTSLSDSG